MSKNKVIINQLLVCDADHLLLTQDADESLSSPERRRLAQIANPRQAKLFLLARYLLRQLLAPQLHIAPQQIPISLHHKGKPQLLNSDWHFNISHTGSLLALAIGNQAPLGVDLEARQLSSAQIQRLARRYFNEQEQTWLAAHPEPEYFLRLWTIKEAVLKAHGGGIANNLSAVQWRPNASHALFGDHCYQLAHFLLPPAQDTFTPANTSSHLTLAIQGRLGAPVELLAVTELGLALEISGAQPNLYNSPNTFSF